RQLRGNGFATAFELELLCLADGGVTDVVERFELREIFAVDLHQDVARLDRRVTRRRRQHFAHHEHARELWERLANGGLCRGGETEALQLIVRRIAEHGFERATRW